MTQIVRGTDFLSALVLFVLGMIAILNTGDDVRNWLFPLMATYLILAISAVLFLRAILGALLSWASTPLTWKPSDTPVLVDTLIFGAIMIAYLFSMFGLGFWIASFLMLSITSIHLTQMKTRRNMGLAIIVPLVTCVVAYVVFLHIFYVPLPQAEWWRGLR